MSNSETSGHLGRTSERLSRPEASIEVVGRGYTVIRTPTKPSYRYGNLIVIDKPPTPSALGSCVALYRRLAPRHALPQDATVAWEERLADSLPNYSTAPLGHRFSLLYDDVLTFDHDCNRVDRVDLRLLVIGSDDWAVVQDMALPSDGFVIDGTRKWLLSERRSLVSMGRGVWWGAWNGSDRLLATCGAFTGGSLVRLDQLLVAPEVRRKGIRSGWAGNDFWLRRWICRRRVRRR